MITPNWIDRPDALAAGLSRWRRAGQAAAIALDTEFVFERTFRPRLGLIQIAAGDEIALVDAVRLPDLRPLAELFAEEAGRKVLHSGSGDVPLLFRATGFRPRPLFDTQIAAAFVGLGPSLSYAALVRELFGVELPKHETRTDWIRRPLSAAQLRYAAEDVEHLVAAAEELERRLLALGRLDWVLEESAALAELQPERAEPLTAWRRVRGLDRLPPPARAVARALAAWRELEAERLDLARSFVLRDETLLALARRSAITADEAAELPGFEARRHARHAANWVTALTAAHAAVDSGTAPPEPTTLPAREREIRRALDEGMATIANRRAGELGLAPELLLSRRQRERAIAAWRERGVPSLAEAIGGFRGRLLGAEIDALAVSTAS